MSARTKGWWHSATKEERLAQIKGGIECGMNSRHVALNVGASRHVVADYAARHGMNFDRSGRAHTEAVVRKNVQVRQAYFSGVATEFLELWRPA